MTWANVRGAMVSTIEGLTPGDVTRGGRSFRHVTTNQIEDSSKDREYVVRMVEPPAQASQVLNGVDWRWLTGFTVMLRYNRTVSVTHDEDRIAADVIQIQQSLSFCLYSKLVCYRPLAAGLL